MMDEPMEEEVAMAVAPPPSPPVVKQVRLTRKKVVEKIVEEVGGDEGTSDPSDNGEVERPYRCKIPGCLKSYKNPGGLKVCSLVYNRISIMSITAINSTRVIQS